MRKCSKNRSNLQRFEVLSAEVAEPRNPCVDVALTLVHRPFRGGVKQQVAKPTNILPYIVMNLDSKAWRFYNLPIRLIYTGVVIYGLFTSLTCSTCSDQDRIGILHWTQAGVW